MVDRTVYLVEQVTDVMIDHELTFVSDADLARLMESGWEVTTNMPRTIAVGSDKVQATMLILRRADENRGLSARERRDVAQDMPVPGRAHGTVVTMDEFGMPRAMTVPEAFVKVLEGMQRGLSNLGEHPGHLGAPGQHNIPGLTVISGTSVSKAFDMGMIAGARGEPKESNPFPPGTDASTKWLQGYAKRNEILNQQASKSEIDEADKHGFNLAQELGEDDSSEVNCPYSNPQLRAAWVSGFKRGGGKVLGG